MLSDKFSGDMLSTTQESTDTVLPSSDFSQGSEAQRGNRGLPDRLQLCSSTSENVSHAVSKKMPDSLDKTDIVLKFQDSQPLAGDTCLEPSDVH